MSIDERLFTYDAPCVSNCCGDEVYCETDICSCCKEVCLVVCIDDDTGDEYKETKAGFNSEVWMKAKDMNVGRIITAVFDGVPFEIVITSKATSVDTVLFTAEAVSLEKIDDDTGEDFIYNDGDKNESKRT